MLLPAKDLPSPSDLPTFGYRRIAGSLVEISGSGQLSLVSSLLAEAQQQGELCGWISTTLHTVFPPDLERNGVDLSLLTFFWIDTPTKATKALEYLLRSEAFGLIVLDMSKHPGIPDGIAGRLMRLAGKVRCGVVALSALKGTFRSIFGSLTSLRLDTRLEPAGEGRLDLTLTAERDRRAAPQWRRRITYHAPIGLR
ncbi:MAG: hypothetical protein ACOCW6_02315 [Spirochaetota bacterium]